MGKSLSDLNLRKKYKAQVLGVQRSDEDEIDYVPSPEEPFRENDLIWLFGPRESLQDRAH